jgi:hypothetical protein
VLHRLVGEEWPWFAGGERGDSGGAQSAEEIAAGQILARCGHRITSSSKLLSERKITALGTAHVWVNQIAKKNAIAVVRRDLVWPGTIIAVAEHRTVEAVVKVKRPLQSSASHLVDVIHEQWPDDEWDATTGTAI